ncbi:DUF4129 domain-containing protein [Microbacterium sp. ZW T6_19]|uniref:DUF4129 domain-containing protein n=1 Tax=Microbacterium sp. ZW T6_19 TaxID=3378082 RepID=UPI0038546D85
MRRHGSSPERAVVWRGGLLFAVVALFLIVMIAAAMQGAARIHPIGGTPEPRPLETMPVLPGASGTPTPEPLPPNPVTELLGAVILGILVVLVGVGVIVLIVLLVRTLVGAWHDRPLRRRDGDEVGLAIVHASVDPEPEVIAAAIQRGIAGALREIDERPLPEDAIVAAWVGLEESAADAGLVRGASETPGEFAVRIITRRAGITAEAETLLRLYERVRFGGHPALEDDRAVARAALKNIEVGWR